MAQIEFAVTFNRLESRILLHDVTIVYYIHRFQIKSTQNAFINNEPHR